MASPLLGPSLAIQGTRGKKAPGRVNDLRKEGKVEVDEATVCDAEVKEEKGATSVTAVTSSDTRNGLFAKYVAALHKTWFLSLLP